MIFFFERLHDFLWGEDCIICFIERLPDFLVESLRDFLCEEVA